MHNRLSLALVAHAALDTYITVLFFFFSAQSNRLFGQQTPSPIRFIYLFILVVIFAYVCLRCALLHAQRGHRAVLVCCGYSNAYVFFFF